MEQNPPTQLDRLALQQQFGSYSPVGPPDPVPMVPFKGLDAPMSGSEGEGPDPSTLEGLYDTMLAKPQSDGKITGGSVSRTQGEMMSDRYPYFIPDYNNEDAYAQGQGWVTKMTNGVGKGILLASTTLLQSTVGMVNGAIQWGITGKASSFYNNDMNRWVDEVNKIAENALPNYYKDVEKNAHWYSPASWGTANFFWDGIVKNLGFSAGAMASGALFAAGLRALPLTAKLFSIGKAAETLQATEKGLLAADKVAGTYGKVRGLSDSFLGQYKLLNPGGRLLVAGLATTGEASFESYQNLNQYRDNLIAAYRDGYTDKDGNFHLGKGYDPTNEDLAKINSLADGVGNTSMLANIALLSVTNYIQLPKILGSSYRIEKGMITTLARKTNEIVKDGGKFIENKIFAKKILRPLSYTFSISEGFEEGSQYAITIGTQDYYKKKYNNEPTSFMESLFEGVKETVSTDEGMQNVLIGGLSGSLMQARGRFRQNSEKDRNTLAALGGTDWTNPGLNSRGLSDFTQATLDAVNRGTTLQEERELALKEGRILDSKDKEMDYIINYVSPRIKYGRYDLVKADLEDYRILASTEEGFSQLQQEGKILEGDTKEAFLQRLSSFEATAENVKSLYQSLHLRYGDRKDEKGNLIYTSEVMDKMIYAATKVADYDARIPKLSGTLAEKGVSVDIMIQDITQGQTDIFNQLLEDVKIKTGLNEDQRLDLGVALNDVANMVLRRQMFLKEYDEIKNNPNRYKEKVAPVITTTPGEAPEVVKVKTKTGDKDLTVGTEYFIGKGFNYDKDGLETPVTISKLTVMGEDPENANNILIKTNTGEVRSISKEELLDYKITPVEKLLSDKKANYFFEHRNELFEINLGKKNGGKMLGRLEFVDGKMYIVYKGYKNKLVHKEITGKFLVPQKGYTQAMIRPTGKFVESESQKKAREEITSKEELEKQELTAVDNRGIRIQILTDLYDDIVGKQASTDKLLEEKRVELENLRKDLSTLEEAILNTQDDVDKRYKKVTFKAATKKALATAKRLSILQDKLEQEIKDLESQKDALDIDLSYITEMEEHIDELPTDSKEFLHELRGHKNLLADMLLNTEVQIESTSRLIGKVDDALNKAVDFILDLIDKFKANNWNAPTSFAPDVLGQQVSPDTLGVSFVMNETWSAFLKDHPNFMKLKPNYKADLKVLEDMMAQVEDNKVAPNEKKLEELNALLKDLQEELPRLQKELKATNLIVARFEEIAKAHKEQKAQEKMMAQDEALLKAALGTEHRGVQTKAFDKDYEQQARKDEEILGRSSVGVMDGKPHQVRANTFGFNMESFKNRWDLRSIDVTSKTEKEVGLEGLIDLLRTDPTTGKPNEDIDKDDVIVMVMADVDGNLVDVEGDIIPEGADRLNTAIYQVRPGAKLERRDGTSMFRSNTIKERPEVVTEFTARYKAWRDEVLAKTTLGNIQDNLHEIEASFGTPEYVTHLDEEGKKVKHYDTRTSAEAAGLLTPTKLESTPVIVISKNSDKKEKGTVSFKAPYGVPLLDVDNGLVKLQNRKHTEAEAETIYQSILLLARYMMDPKVGIESLKSKRIFDYLRSIVYWGIPTDQQGNRKLSLGYNSIFWEKGDDGKFMLSMSGLGKNFIFTPSSLEQNKHDIMVMLREMYNNVNSSMANDLQAKYEEILSISDKGEIEARLWPNYQTYLLAEKTPEGKTRIGAELPLSTLLRPLTKEQPTNRTGIYFFTSDTADKWVAADIKKTNKSIKPGVLNTPVEKPVSTGVNNKYTLGGGIVNVFITKGGSSIKFTAEADVSKENLKDKIELKQGADRNKVYDLLTEGPKGLIAKLSKEEGRVVTQAEARKVAEVMIKGLIFNDLNIKRAAPSNDESFTIEGVPSAPSSNEEESFTIKQDESEGANSNKLQDLLDAAKRKAASPGARLIVEEKLKNFKKEDWKGLEAWLKANVPNIPIYRVKNVIQATNGKQAWGMFRDGAVYVYENAEVGTAYHEVFHAIRSMFTSPEENAAIDREVRSRKGSFTERATGKEINYSKATNKQIEEKLAEEFREYIHDKKIPIRPTNGRPYVLKLFSDLINFIRHFFTGRNAQFNVEQLFKNINEGAYKDVIPYATELSFAKKGILDIEEAFAGDGSEFSLAVMRDRERNDVIQDMTYLTLVELIATDKSLFTIPKISKQDLYIRLKAQVLARLDSTIEAANSFVSEGIATQKDVDDAVIKPTEILKQGIEDQWENIVVKHQEQLRSYSIEFDEYDQIALSDDNKGKDDPFGDSTKIDSFKKANSAIKLLLATLPKVDENNNLVPSSTGGVILIPLSKTQISLYRKLHNARSMEDMVERIREMAKNDINYRSLYKRITKSDWSTAVDLSRINTEHGAQILTALWRTFKKQNPDVRNVFILENGDVVVGEANLSQAANQIRSTYIDSVVSAAKAGSGFFTYNAKEKMFIGDPEAVRLMNINSLTAKVAFLNKLGISFTVSEINKLKRDQRAEFIDVVDNIKASIAKAERIATFSGKVLDINGRLLELALIRAIISNPEFDSTFFNISGERTQTFIGTNPADDLYNFLTQIGDFTDANVIGTQYSYLKTDSFVKGSNLLSRMFSSDFKRKKGTEDLMKVGYVGGTDNAMNGKQKPSSKLFYKERLVQELNLNLKGWYLNLVPGDASIEWMIKMGNAITLKELARGMKDINDIFKGYFLSELELAREDNRAVAKDRNAHELRFLRAILATDKNLHSEIMADTRDINKVYDRFEKRINTALASYIKTETEKLNKSLARFGIVEETEGGFVMNNIDIPKNMSKEALDNQLTLLTVNFMINNIELHKLLYADPYQYEDELKRIKNINSPRQAIVSNSPQMNTVFNNVWNKGYTKGNIGYTDFTQDYFQSITNAEIMGITDIPNYGVFRETDGSGIILFKAYRQFRVRAGDWNENEERQYRYDIAWEKQDKGIELTAEEVDLYMKGNPAIKSAYTPIKPIVAGNKANNTSYNNMMLDKFALYPISYRLMSDLNKAGGNTTSNVISLYNKMQGENIDYTVFTNSRKVGRQKEHETYDEEGNFNNTPYTEEMVTKVPFVIMSIQAEVPSKDSPLVSRGTQITKLITMDTMEAGVPVDYLLDKDFTTRYKEWYKLDEAGKLKASDLYKEIKNNQTLLETMMEKGYQNLLRRLGIKEVNKKFVIKDFSKAVQTLREEVLKREVNDNISDALTAFLEGKAVLEATPAYQQIRNILYSMVDKDIIRPKITGGLKVQIPSTLLESGARVKTTNINGKTGYTSDVLGFYVDGDGKRVCEIMIARWFKSSKSDKELLDYLNTSEEGKKILSGLAYRIPTQKQNSIEVFKIKQFLPYEFGDSVVVPAAIVEKTGSDFDIDKLSIYLKNLLVGKNGEPKLIGLLTNENSTVEERYYKWVIDNADKDASKYLKFLSKVEVKSLKDKFKSKFEEIGSKYQSMVEDVKATSYKDLLSNYDRIEEEVFTTQDTYMKELFDQERQIFKTLPGDIREGFFYLRDKMHNEDVNGPEELRNYMKLSIGFLSYEMDVKDHNSLVDMIGLYEQELLVLGATQAQIDSAKTEALGEFRGDKNSAIENIAKLTSSMSEQAKEERATERGQFKADYAKELAEASELLTKEEFVKLPILLQNSKAALENEFIQSSQNLAAHPANYQRLIKPNSSSQLSSLSREITEKTGEKSFDYKEVGNMLDRGYMSSLRHAFVTGKYAIGIAAVNQTNHSLNQRQPIYIDKNRLKLLSKEDQFWIGDAEVKFEAFNRVSINDRMVPTLSMIRNAERSVEFPDGQDISDIISQFIDGYVDIAKDPWIMKLGATPNVTGTFLFLAKIGVPIDTIGYFMNQPIIKDYLHKIDSAGYSWLFIDDFVEDIIGGPKYAVDAVDIVIKQIPGKATLKANLGKEDFTKQEKEQQQFMLREFLKYAKMANQMFLVTQGANFDTAHFNDPYLVFKKMKQLEKAQNTILGSIDGGIEVSAVDALLKNSFVGKLGSTISETRNALSEILKSDQTRVRAIIQKVIEPFVDMSDDDFVKLAQKAVNDLFDYAVQTGDDKYNADIKDILLRDGGVADEIMDFVKKVKADRSHPLFHNPVIDVITKKDSPKAGFENPNNIRIKGVDNKVYDQNMLIYGFREIRDYLGNSPLYKRLVLLAFLQSGLSTSAISFTSVLPYEDFEELYNKMLSKIDTIPNLENFYTLDVFQRNNWGNDDIIPHKRAALIISKKNNKAYYNPSMAFWGNPAVAKAVEKKQIPNLLTQSLRNRESESEFIVYTWERQEDLITPDHRKQYPRLRDFEIVKIIKTEMRKIADYSFIQKGLFKKVKYDSGETLMTKDKNDNDYYVYKAINAWGDSFRANEFYDVDHKSVIDNGFVKVEDVNDNKVISIFTATKKDSTKEEVITKTEEKKTDNWQEKDNSCAKPF